MTSFVEQIAIHVLGDDRARLVALHAELATQLPAMAARLCEASYPAIARLLAGADLAAVRVALTEWMASGLRGPYDVAFGEQRSRLGRRLAECGLPQHGVFVAMTAVRREYGEQIAALYAGDEARQVARAVDALLDLELAALLDQRDAGRLERERRIQSERVAALQTLSAGLAHEVRNPVNSAKLQLEVLGRRLRRELDDPRLLEPIELVHQEIERLTRLLNEFLAFARPSDLHLGRHDVSSIAHDVVAHERALAVERGATISLADGAPVIATVDPTKFGQILQNLIRNAAEAVASGGRIDVIVRADAANLYVEVADDGPGIPDEIRHRIYEPFFSTKEGGTGLGMSIVHSMVALHGGVIGIDSGPRGTRCEVVMPRSARPVART